MECNSFQKSQTVTNWLPEIIFGVGFWNIWVSYNNNAVWKNCKRQVLPICCDEKMMEMTMKWQWNDDDSEDGIGLC